MTIATARALAMSRNIATVKVAEQTGYDKIVALWRKTKIGEQDQVKPYPSVALGVVELTPLEVAEAYTVFPNRGSIKKLRSIVHERLASRVDDVCAGGTFEGLVARIADRSIEICAVNGGVQPRTKAREHPQSCSGAVLSTPSMMSVIRFQLRVCSWSRRRPAAVSA